MKTTTQNNTKPVGIRKSHTPILPSGIDNFYDLITHRNEEGDGYLFVDKSLFIRDFLNAGDKITLITRPRRFGKTLTLSMLQHFLAAEVSGKSTKGLFDGLNISQYPETMKKQGQYPVIFLTLKEAKGKSFEEIFARIKDIITETFQCHRYLFDTNLTEEDSIKFKKILNEAASKTDYEKSLKFLSKLLYQHTGKKVYILLDEYNTPINDAYLHGCYETCRSFLAAMFGKAFKGNNFLKNGLITGILKIAKASLFSELNNPQVYTILNDARYTPYFGFTEAETDDLLDRAKLPQKAHELKEMYNGYQVRKTTLYNPSSIVSFAKNAALLPQDEMGEALQSYWINTGGTHLIGDMISHNLMELKEDLITLLDKKDIQTQIDEHIVYDPHLRHNPVGFWSVLLLSGYVKSIENHKDVFGDSVHTICFPNEEVRVSMRQLILRVSFGKKDTQALSQAMKALAAGKVALFIRFVKEYIRYALSYFDGDKEEKEKPYHMLILGLMAFFANTHHVRSNRESGDGRYDIGLEPKLIHKNMKAIIIEIKVASESENLKQVAQKAFQQIKDKSYKADMEARGITDYVLLGMAFSGKEVEVVYA